MSEDPTPIREDEEDVDLDLDLITPALRDEAVGNPTTVRIDGKVIHVQHANDWSSSAMRDASNGRWEEWARTVIEDDDEYKVWLDADLRNFQIEAIFTQCARKARLNQGKSTRFSGSRNRTRRK
jgi:hypothetical protein